MTAYGTAAQRRGHAAPAARVGARAGGALAASLFTLGLGLAVLALLGPLATGVIEYRVTETLRNQTIGLDTVSLAVVAPLAVAAGLLVLRGHVAGQALGLGIGPYTAYMMLQYVLGPEYRVFPGNNELLFPLCLALFTVGWVVSLTAWKTLGGELLPGSPRRDRLIGTVVLPILALVTFVRYVPALADAMSRSPEEAGYLAGPTFFWTIALLDLGVLLPATVAACIGLRRGAPWSHRAMYLVAGWLGLIGPAVAGMGIVMYLNDDPAASGGGAVFMTALGLAFALLAVILYRPLFGSAARGEEKEGS